jgi:hypothetical protein
MKSVSQCSSWRENIYNPPLAGSPDPTSRQPGDLPARNRFSGEPKDLGLDEKGRPAPGKSGGERKEIHGFGSTYAACDGR